MKKLNAETTYVYSSKFDTQIKDRLTLAEMESICQDVMTADGYFEREARLVAGVLVYACEEIDVETQVEDVIASGLWDEVQEILKADIKKIREGIAYYDSLGYVLTKLMDNVTDELNNLVDKIPTLDKVIDAMGYSENSEGLISNGR